MGIFNVRCRRDRHYNGGSSQASFIGNSHVGYIDICKLVLSLYSCCVGRKCQYLEQGLHFNYKSYCQLP